MNLKLMMGLWALLLVISSFLKISLTAIASQHLEKQYIKTGLVSLTKKCRR